MMVMAWAVVWDGDGDRDGFGVIRIGMVMGIGWGLE